MDRPGERRRRAAVKTQWARSMRSCFTALSILSSRSSSWFNRLQVYLERARSGDVSMNISRQGMDRLHLVHVTIVVSNGCVSACIRFFFRLLHIFFCEFAFHCHLIFIISYSLEASRKEVHPQRRNCWNFARKRCSRS